MNVARWDFVSLVYEEVEPQLADLAQEAAVRGFDVSMSGVVGGSMPGIRFGVGGVGEVGYWFYRGEVIRQWRATPDAEPEEREATLEEVARAPEEVLSMLQRQGFVSR
jgi:hypothetical protein